MSKFLGFLLGVAVALAGPAVFGVLAAPGGIELNAKGMALAFGIGALIFWAVVSYFSGAGALGAFVAFGTLVYCWLWIPNRTTNFLNDVPGVTNGMIEGSKQYTLNGVVPILGVISLVYAIQLIVLSVQRRRRERVEAERLQREQEAAQAQQEADVAAVYPVAGGTYQEPAAYERRSAYDDLFAEPAPVQPRNQADEQTRQFPVQAEEVEQTRQFPQADADSNHSADETVVAPAPVPEAVQEPAQEPVQEPEQPAASVEQPQPVAATPQAAAAPQAATDAPAPVQPETEPEKQNAPQQTEQETAQQAEQQAEQRTAERRISPQEQMGSQYRERMEDPEDTGEFHLAFENPIIRPA
ncbi:hypothetical protein [Kribbella sp. NPDC048915]|uniref:hypothetical protein n=1 Tax=Kribbella sp. NPDC048915 TaxID=3155148 RepID=UPI0033C47368